MKNYILFLTFAFAWLFACVNASDSQFLETVTIYSGSLDTIRGLDEEADRIRNFPKDLYGIHLVEGLGAFYLDSREDIIKNNLRRGEVWEKNIADLIRKYAVEGSTVIDIGAHVGTHTLTMSKEVGAKGKVIAFEPQKKIYSELVQNMDINNCQNVDCYRCAVGSCFDHIEMNPSVLDNEGGTGIGKGGDQAPIIPLDGLELDHVSFIKIDVENGEFDVLKGARRTILKNLPVMIIEIMGNTYSKIENRSDRIREILRYIEEMGYQLSYIEGSWSDWLAIPLDQNALSLPKSRPTVCLNMIVKNEKDVIERCLQSVLNLIDYWVIVDTGSTDGTQEVIEAFMKKHAVKGELYERPWKNFSHNRNEALNLAKDKGDYLFFIDADEYLVYNKGFKLPNLDKDYYYLNVLHAGSRYGKMQFVKSSLDWAWVGVLHEYLSSPSAKTSATIEGVETIYTTEGARSKDPLKYQKDAAVLEEALKQEPNNERYVFYLAQSYRDAQNYDKALEWYKKRVIMGGWDQEVFYSLLQIGVIKEALNMPVEDVLESYFQAFSYRPSRAEPLYRIAHLYRREGNFEKGYQVASIAAGIPFPDDLLFVEEWIYHYGILLEGSIAAYWTGKYEESQRLSLQILKLANLPENVEECVRKNLEFANVKLVEVSMSL